MQPKSSDRIIALAPLSILELSPPAMVRCASEAGFTHMGLRLLPPRPDELAYPMTGDTPMVRETQALLSDTGVRVLDVEVFSLRADTVVNAYLPTLETAALLGAAQVLVTGNSTDEHLIADLFGQLCDEAAQFGLVANLEPIPSIEIRTVGQAARIISEANRENAGLLIDAVHFFRAASELRELKSIPREWFHYMQLDDSIVAPPDNPTRVLPPSRSERLYPGDGELDLMGLLRALPGDIPISLEIPMVKLAETVPAAQRARTMLTKTRDLLARAESEGVSANSF